MNRHTAENKAEAVTLPPMYTLGLTAILNCGR